ncbi:MAG: 6-bladed beta-propeller [Marinilabiliaceae bacterium]
MASLLLVALSCTRYGQSEIECSKAQQERLLSDSVVSQEAEKASLVEIDVSDILESRFDFADVVRDLRFIPLETTKESRLGNVRRLTFSDGYIIASDAKNVKVFTSGGRYVGGIPFGSFSRRNDYTVDRAGGEILVYTQGSIGHYGMDCQRRWVESVPLNFTAMNTTASGDRLVMFFDPDDHNPVIGDYDGAPFLVMDRRGALVAKPEVARRVGVPPREGMALAFSCDGVVVTMSGCDTIYAFSDSSFSARYALRYACGQSFSANSEVCRYFFAGNALMTPDCLFFKIQGFRANTLFAFYDVRKNRLVGGLPVIDYRLVPPIYNPIATCGDSFAAVFNPYLAEDGREYTFAGNVVPESAKAALRGVRHDDNPVVALYRVEVE